MRKHPHSQFRRSSPRVFAAIGLCLVGAWLAMLSLAAPMPASFQPEIREGERVRPSEFRGDVRNLPRDVSSAQRNTFSRRPLEHDLPVPATKQVLPGVQPTTASTTGTSTQTVQGPLAPMPGPSTSFNGMNYNANGAGHPPDTVGDVGPNHFVQAVNTSVGIYDKATGAALATFTFDGLWSGAGTGTPCDTDHGGDPTVIYDPQHDRFIVADFSWADIQNGPYYECVAVSKTSDPVSGGWWRYAVRADDAAHPWFPDYPKMGIWPDGLYMTTNMFDCLDSVCGNANFKEARVYALNIDDLVNGATLRSVVADTNSSRYSLLPSNYRGTPPPAGRENLVVAESGNLYACEVYKFHVDYAVPSNSTFTGPINVSQTQYVGAADPVASSGNNIDTLSDRAMMQNQYRNFGGVESLWVNHTVGTTSASTPTGIQWAQIDVTGGNITTTPVQEQISNNGADGLSRFMGSLAVDHAGNVAVGYAAESVSVAPDVRYAGRLSTDPLNALPQTEVTMLPSVSRSVQTGNCGSSSCTRWGDYSAMTVDPTDDCTFWYTHMYYAAPGLNWITRIGSFKFSTCSAGPTPTPTPTPTPGATPTPTPTPTPAPTGPAVMLSPPPGSTLTSSSVTFQWSAGSATAYGLFVGSSPGSANIYASSQLSVRSVTVSNIPTDGRTIYVRLYSQVNGSWVYNSYTYRAFNASATPTPTPAPTPTPTATPTPTPSPTVTPTPTPTATPTPTPTATPTPTPTPTATPTPTPTPGSTVATPFI